MRKVTCKIVIVCRIHSGGTRIYEGIEYEVDIDFLPRTLQFQTNKFLSSLRNIIKQESAAIADTNPRDAKACKNCSNSTCLQHCR